MNFLLTGRMREDRMSVLKKPFLKCVFVCLYHLQALRLVNRYVDKFQPKKHPDNKQSAFPFIEKRRSRNVQILVYHRVNDERDAFFPATPTITFRNQMEYLAENFNICSLAEAVERLKKDDVPENTVVVTFDDGYRDNYLYAFPVLQRLSIPATIFLATGAIGPGKALWHDLVFSAFRNTKTRFLRDCSAIGAGYSLQSLSEKLAAQREVLQFLWSLKDEERVTAINRLRRTLGVSDSVEQDLMLSWNEIKLMHNYGIFFGSHTSTHPILSRVSADRLRSEIVDSKLAIEINLHCKVEAFAYPVGRSQDFDNQTKALLKEAGYNCAVTSRFGINSSNQDLFELRRGTPWEEDLPSFAMKLAWYRFACDE